MGASLKRIAISIAPNKKGMPAYPSRFHGQDPGDQQRRQQRSQQQQNPFALQNLLSFGGLAAGAVQPYARGMGFIQAFDPFAHGKGSDDDDSGRKTVSVKWLRKMERRRERHTAKLFRFSPPVMVNDFWVTRVRSIVRDCQIISTAMFHLTSNLVGQLPLLEELSPVFPDKKKAKMFLEFLQELFARLTINIVYDFCTLGYTTLTWEPHPIFGASFCHVDQRNVYTVVQKNAVNRYEAYTMLRDKDGVRTLRKAFKEGFSRFHKASPWKVHPSSAHADDNSSSDSDTPTSPKGKKKKKTKKTSGDDDSSSSDDDDDDDNLSKRSKDEKAVEALGNAIAPDGFVFQQPVAVTFFTSTAGGGFDVTDGGRPCSTILSLWGNVQYAQMVTDVYARDLQDRPKKLLMLQRTAKKQSGGGADGKRLSQEEAVTTAAIDAMGPSCTSLYGVASDGRKSADGDDDDDDEKRKKDGKKPSIANLPPTYKAYEVPDDYEATLISAPSTQPIDLPLLNHLRDELSAAMGVPIDLLSSQSMNKTHKQMSGDADSAALDMFKHVLVRWTRELTPIFQELYRRAYSATIVNTCRTEEKAQTAKGEKPTKKAPTTMRSAFDFGADNVGLSAVYPRPIDMAIVNQAYKDGVMKFPEYKTLFSAKTGIPERYLPDEQQKLPPCSENYVDPAEAKAKAAGGAGKKKKKKKKKAKSGSSKRAKRKKTKASASATDVDTYRATDDDDGEIVYTKDDDDDENEDDDEEDGDVEGRRPVDPADEPGAGPVHKGKNKRQRLS